MEKEILVSVIIPVYNVEQYLRECLDSVVNQTLREIEIICIDDGSTDGSPEILREYAGKDERIVIYTQENKGLSGARNAGIDRAAGEYIYFIDSDDSIKHETLQELYEFAECKDIDVLFFSADVLYENEEAYKNRRHVTENYYYRTNDYSQVISGFELFSKMQANNEYRCSACMYITKKDHILKHNLRFYEGILHEDDLFSFLNIMQAKKAAHINKPYYNRRVRYGSIVANNLGYRDFYGYLIDYMNIEAFAKKRNYADDVMTQVNRFLEGMQNAMISMYSSHIDADDWFKELSNIEKFHARRIITRKPLISVIISVYNDEKYLARCIDSVLNQTIGKQNLEIIIINDGSTDGSFKVLQKYASEHKEITVIDQANMGLGASRNKGVTFAEGDYLAFLDSDDYLPEDAYELLYNATNNGEYNIVAGRAMSIFPDGTTWLMFEDWYVGENENGFVADIEDYKQHMELLGSAYMCFKLFKTEIIKENNVTCPTDIYYEDIGFVSIAQFYARKIKVINANIYCYMRRPNSITETKNNRAYIDVFKAIEFTYHAIEKHNLLRYKHIFDYLVLNFYFIRCDRATEFVNKSCINKYALTVDEYDCISSIIYNIIKNTNNEVIKQLSSDSKIIFEELIAHKVMFVRVINEVLDSYGAKRVIWQIIKVRLYHHCPKWILSLYRKARK